MYLFAARHVAKQPSMQTSRAGPREEKTRPDWSEESEPDRPRPSSPARQSTAKIENREFIVKSSSKSSELSELSEDQASEDQARTASHSKAQRTAHRDKKQKGPSANQIPRSAASASSMAEPEAPEEEEAEKLPMTVAVPGRRQDIAKLTGRKVRPEVFRERLLANRVQAIWNFLDQGTKEYLDPESTFVNRHPLNAFLYLQSHGGNLLRDVHSLFAEVKWETARRLPPTPAVEDEWPSHCYLG